MQQLQYTLEPAIFANTDNNFIIKSLHPNEIKINITIDDITLRSNLTTNETIKFTNKFFLNTILGFTQNHSRPLSDREGFFHKLPGSFKSDKPINNITIDKVHQNCNCNNGSIVNGVRKPILYSLLLISIGVIKYMKTLESNFSKR